MICQLKSRSQRRWKMKLKKKRRQARRMAAQLGQVSSKVMVQMTMTRRTAHSNALMNSLKDKRKELETRRNYMLGIAVRKHITPKEIQKEIMLSANVITETAEMLRMARAFKKES